MKNKKLFIIVGIILLVSLIGFLVFRFLTKEDKITTLNLFEKQWIESNKNNLIDMSIIDGIPILSYNGEGIILDFLADLNKETNLSFNKVSYKIGDEIKSDYSFKMVDEVAEDNILIYEDNYVVVTKQDTYLTIDALKGLTIGVLNENLNNINNYLYNADVSYKTYETEEELINEFNKQDTSLNASVLLKTTNLKQLIDNKYRIAYNICDYKKYDVLDLGET